MADNQVVQGGQPIPRMMFWIGTLVVVLVVVLGLIMALRWVGDSTADLAEELNARYVEKIEIDSVARGGGGQMEVIVIDGTSRRDCEEEDARLICSDDPQPTLAG